MSNKLAACVNIIPQITSVSVYNSILNIFLIFYFLTPDSSHLFLFRYEWKNEINEDSELLLVRTLLIMEQFSLNTFFISNFYLNVSFVQINWQMIKTRTETVDSLTKYVR